MKLLLATRNRGKITELRAGLEDLGCEIVTLQDLDVQNTFEEPVESFRTCSLLKASFFYTQTGIPTLAEDSGLAVDALHGEPGIKSRRWPGYEASDDELLNMLLERLRGVVPEQRTAHFISAVTFVFDQQNTYTAEHRVQGSILENPTPPIPAGVPWSALFYIPDAGKVFSQLTAHEKNAISHRGGALRKVKPFIIKHAQYAGQ